MNFGAKPVGMTGGTTGGFNFGTQNTAATGTAGSGFSFGQTQPATTANKSLFGTPATQAQSSFSFGTLGTATTAAAPATTTASGFGFGTTPLATAATTSAGGFGFGATPIASSSGTGFSLGGATATATPASGFSFGNQAAPASSAPTAGFFGALGTTASTAPSTGFSFPSTGLGGVQTSTATTSAAGLGGIGVGLGGAQPPSANAGNNNAGVKSDGKSTKEQMLSQDVFATIALFETRRDAENSASEENIRQTAGPFHKVGKKAAEIQQLLGELAGEYQHLHASALSLKADVMKEAEHMEMARRTKDTPMALQGENKAPEQYFINLVRTLEAQMMDCRTKIEEVAVCMQAANNPCQTPDDISEVLQREYDALKELASKLYAKHSQLVELAQRLRTAAQPSDQGFFRAQAKEDSKTPASAVVRPVLGGSSSGLQAFQEQQQRAKAVTLGAAPPTMPLAQTSTSSLFGSNPNSSMFSGNKSFFGTTGLNLNNSQTSNSTFGGVKPFTSNTLPFGNVSAFGSNTSTSQSSSPFAISSPFNSKPFAEDDGDGRRKRRL